MSRIALLAFAIASHVATLHAQTTRSAADARDTVDRFVDAEMARMHIPGVSLAVVRAGKVIKAQGYGMADLENGIAVTPETVFKIGSVSKQYLATGIMLLAQDGRLTVDDPVAKYVPGAPDSWGGITLRRFLTHTSGVLREGPAFDPLKVQPDTGHAGIRGATAGTSTRPNFSRCVRAGHFCRPWSIWRSGTQRCTRIAC